MYKVILLAGLMIAGQIIAPRQASACDPNAECSRCAATAPEVCLFGKCSGGQCIQHFNDPVCEAKKAQCQVCVAPLIAAGMDPQQALASCP